MSTSFSDVRSYRDKTHGPGDCTCFAGIQGAPPGRGETWTGYALPLQPWTRAGAERLSKLAGASSIGAAGLGRWRAGFGEAGWGMNLNGAVQEKNEE